MNVIRRIANNFGLEVTRLNRVSDISDYLHLYSKKSVSEKKFYNVGAGDFYHPCWTNIDREINKAAKYPATPPIIYDLFSLKQIPVESGTAELIYTSHTLEHITDTAVEHFLNESFRLLKKNGFLRIVIPNIDLDYNAWKKNDRKYFFWINAYINGSHIKANLLAPLSEASTEQIFLENFASTASVLVKEGSSVRITDEELKNIFNDLPYHEALNYCTARCDVEIQKKYAFHHINWFNKEKLFKMLRAAGFQNIYQSGYGQSFAHVLRNVKYFDNTLPQISLYMEALK